MGRFSVVFLEVLGPVFPIFAVLETGLKIDGFSGGIQIQHSWGGAAKLRFVRRP